MQRMRAPPHDLQVLRGIGDRATAHGHMKDFDIASHFDSPRAAAHNMLGAWSSPTTKMMNLDGIDSRTEDARAWTPIAALETAKSRDRSPSWRRTNVKSIVGRSRHSLRGVDAGLCLTITLGGLSHRLLVLAVLAVPARIIMACRRV
jgi:hypothetical protein